MDTGIVSTIAKIKQRIAAAAARSHRPPDSVKLLAVTKTIPLMLIERRSAPALRRSAKIMFRRRKKK